MIIRKVYKVLSPNLIELQHGDRVRLISVSNERYFKAEDEDDSEADSAINYLTRLINGRFVKLEFGKKMLDAKGNLLAYVYIKTSKEGDPVWSMINKRMLSQGYADHLVDPLNVQYSLDFEFLRDVAKEKRKRIWATE